MSILSIMDKFKGPKVRINLKSSGSGSGEFVEGVILSFDVFDLEVQRAKGAEKGDVLVPRSSVSTIIILKEEEENEDDKEDIRDLHKTSAS